MFPISRSLDQALLELAQLSFEFVGGEVDSGGSIGSDRLNAYCVACGVAGDFDFETLPSRPWIPQFGKLHIGDRAVIDIASRSGLVRAVLAAGPDAVVLSPPDLVEAVVAGLDDLSASLAQGAAR